MAAPATRPPYYECNLPHRGPTETRVKLQAYEGKIYVDIGEGYVRGPTLAEIRLPLIRWHYLTRRAAPNVLKLLEIVERGNTARFCPVDIHIGGGTRLSYTVPKERIRLSQYEVVPNGFVKPPLDVIALEHSHFKHLIERCSQEIDTWCPSIAVERPCLQPELHVLGIPYASRKPAVCLEYISVMEEDREFRVKFYDHLKTYLTGTGHTNPQAYLLCDECSVISVDLRHLDTGKNVFLATRPDCGGLPDA